MCTNVSVLETFVACVIVGALRRTNGSNIITAIFSYEGVSCSVRIRVDERFVRMLPDLLLELLPAQFLILLLNRKTIIVAPNCVSAAGDFAIHPHRYLPISPSISLTIARSRSPMWFNLILSLLRVLINI